jgi:hypothetical protein
MRKPSRGSTGISPYAERYIFNSDDVLRSNLALSGSSLSFQAYQAVDANPTVKTPLRWQPLLAIEWQLTRFSFTSIRSTNRFGNLSAANSCSRPSAIPNFDDVMLELDLDDLERVAFRRHDMPSTDVEVIRCWGLLTWPIAEQRRDGVARLAHMQAIGSWETLFHVSNTCTYACL